MENNNCDGSRTHDDGPVKRMPLPRGAGLILCHVCWDYELEFRRARNAFLRPAAQYDLPKWATAQEVR